MILGPLGGADRPVNHAVGFSSRRSFLRLLRPPGSRRLSIRLCPGTIFFQRGSEDQNPAIINGTAWSEDPGKWFYTVHFSDGMTEHFEERDLVRAEGNLLWSRKFFPGR